MSALWDNHAMRLIDLLNSNNETQAHLYLEQLLLFPVNIQDEIIEKISSLPNCNREAVSAIIFQYSMPDVP